MFHYRLIASLIVLTAVWLTPNPSIAAAQATPDMLGRIADVVLADPSLKPLMRKALSPRDTSGPLQFRGQGALTKQMVEAYLDRCVSHMIITDERSKKFFHDSGAKFIHWSDASWSRGYTVNDWISITAAADAVHSTDWGQDIIFECGVMEAIASRGTGSTLIPKWLLTALEKTGIQKQRTFGPKGKNYFNYEAMFDRTADNWPKRYVGMWSSDPANEQSVPDITMLETQIYYAYLIAEYVDAGFEAVLFGQAMITGARDTDKGAMNSLCNFAKKWAAARGYRQGVMLSSHVFRAWDYEGQPLFTHLSWPTRLSYTDKNPFGMQFGPDVEPVGKRQGGKHLKWIMELPHDLPVLFEIDNYGMSEAKEVCEEGYDEITAYANKTPAQRRDFLKYYYHEVWNWRNKDGGKRAHLSLPGYRGLATGISLYRLPNGEPSKPVYLYVPYKEEGGEEATIAELFRSARSPADFRP